MILVFIFKKFNDLNQFKVITISFLVSTTAAISAAHVFTENNQRMQPQQMILSVARDDLSRGWFSKIS